MKVNDIIAEGIDVNGLAKTPRAGRKSQRTFKTVGLNPSHSTRYPHEVFWWATSTDWDCSCFSG